MEEVLQFDGDRYIAAHSAAERYGLTREHVYELARTGLVPAKFVGKTWYVRGKDLAAFATSHSSHTPATSHTFDTRLRSSIMSVSAREEAATHDGLRSGSHTAEENARVDGISKSRDVYQEGHPVLLQKEKEKKHRREQLLGGLDIRFSDGKPLYFEEGEVRPQRTTPRHRQVRREREVVRSDLPLRRTPETTRPTSSRVWVAVLFSALFVGLLVSVFAWSFTLEKTITINFADDK